jgi:hypothetical protein
MQAGARQLRQEWLSHEVAIAGRKAIHSAKQMARYPSGKGEVCKTFIRRFDSDPRLQLFQILVLTHRPAETLAVRYSDGAQVRSPDRAAPSTGNAEIGKSSTQRNKWPNSRQLNNGRYRFRVQHPSAVIESRRLLPNERSSATELVLYRLCVRGCETCRASDHPKKSCTVEDVGTCFCRYAFTISRGVQCMCRSINSRVRSAAPCQRGLLRAIYSHHL